MFFYIYIYICHMYFACAGLICDFLYTKREHLCGPEYLE
jgi:hypothetical protein